jgi:predicted N-acetyltransferase YhbS
MIENSKLLENIEIKKYETLNSSHLNKIHELYNNSFDLLKISKANFDKKLLVNDYKKIYFIAEINNEVIGYLIIVHNSIVLLIVDELYRNKGIGSKLLSDGELKVKEKYDQINLVAPDFFLCGCPFDTKSNYYKWFERRSFIYEWTPFDMIVNLEEFEYKEDDYSCSLEDVIFKKLDKESDEMALCCNGANSVGEGWGNYYYYDKNEGIIAVKDNKVIGGALIINSILFDMSLKDTGSFGVIWVLPEYEKKGIGIKLYQKGLFELKNKGYKFCHIYYTYKPLDLWYGKLGAKKYIEYWIGSKKL